MRKTKSFRMTEHSINCLKYLSSKYNCSETNIIESLIISQHQLETQLGGNLSFDEILRIIE